MGKQINLKVLEKSGNRSKIWGNGLKIWGNFLRSKYLFYANPFKDLNRFTLHYKI